MCVWGGGSIEYPLNDTRTSVFDVSNPSLLPETRSEFMLEKL